MQIKFDIDIRPEDEAQLASAIGCSRADLETILAGHGQAALREYLEFYLGRRAFSRASDMLEHRLALLIEHAYSGMVPDDARVSQLFQTTLSGSRALIRNTLVKYRYVLAAATTRSAKALLEAVVWRETEYHTRGASANLIELLNQSLAASDSTLKPIMRTPDSVGTYSIDPASYDVLTPVYNAQPVAQQ